jgi:hypothetical protein
MSSKMLPKGQATSSVGSGDRTLAELLNRPELRTKNFDGPAQGMPTAGEGSSSYDLTNPNLHYGARTEVEAYVPDQPRQVSPVNIDGASLELPPARAQTETSIPPIGDVAATGTPIAKIGNEGQFFSFVVPGHFSIPTPGSGLTPSELPIEQHTELLTNSEFGGNPIPVAPSDAHAQSISTTTTPAVVDTGPAVTAIANQTGNEGQAFSLDVSSHFALSTAGDTLTFSASLPTGLSIDARTGIITGTLADADFGSNHITVTVIDSNGHSTSTGFTLTIGDTGPTVTAIANQNGDQGHTFSLDISGHFAAPAAGDTLTYSASLPAGLSIDAHTGTISGTPTKADFGSNPITVTATDAHGQSVSTPFILNVGDTGPTVTAIANQSGNEGQAFSIDVSNHFAAPAAGDALTYSASLPAGLSIDAHTGIISGMPTDAAYGSNPITVTATDAHGQSISTAFALNVGDTGPTVTAIANQSGNEGQALSLDVSSHFAAPAAGDALTYSANLPDGLSIDAHTGVISGMPTDAAYGSNPITVTATDAHGQSVGTAFALNVGDTGPTVTAIANQSGNEGQSFSLDVSSHFAAPAAGDTLTYSASLPSGLSIDAHTGIISGTPTDSDYTSNAHAYNFNFTAFDGSFTVTGQLTTSNSLDPVGGYDVTGIAGSVVGPNGATISSLISNPQPSAESISPDGVFMYDNVLLADSSPVLDYGGILFTSNDREYNIYYQGGTYQLVETAGPNSTAWSEQNGSFAISAIPSSNPITVTATDAHGQSVGTAFALNVGDTGPTVTAIANQSGNEGQSFSLDVSSYFTAPASGDTLTYSASLPAGLSIDAHTGVISGTPTNAEYGSNPITVTATDAHGQSVSTGFTLSVGNFDAINVVPTSENGSQFHTLAIQGISVSDPDASSNVTTTLSAGYGTLTLLTNVSGGLTDAGISENGTGTVTLTGSVSAIDATLAATNGLVYNSGTGAGGYAGTDALTVTTADQGVSGQSAISTVPISIVSASSFSLTGSNDYVYYTSGSNSVSGILGSQGSTFGPGDVLAASGGSNTLLLTADGIVTVTDANFAHVGGFQTLSTGNHDNGANITLGANAAAAGIVNLTLGAANNTVTDTNGLTLNIDATAYNADSSLTLSGSASEIVTGTDGTLTAASLTGTLTVITDSGGMNDPIVITTGSGTTSITDTHSGATVDVHASALTNNTTLTLTGAADEVVTGLIGDLNASSDTGTLTVTTGSNSVDHAVSITTGSGNASITAGGLGDTVTIDASAMSSGHTLTLSGSDVANVTLGSGGLSASSYTGNMTVSAGMGAKTITLGSGTDTLITGSGNETITGGYGSDTFTTHVGDGNDTIHGGIGASWINTIDLHSGTASLGTYGTDWTLTISTGSIVSNDTVNHTITLSHDASGTIHMPDGHSIAFADIDKITYV